MRLYLMTRLPAPLRIFTFLLLLVLFWLPIAIPIQLTIADPNLRAIAAMSVLFVQFLVLLHFWGKAKGYRRVWEGYGLSFQCRSWLGTGLSLAIATCLVLGLFALYGVLGWQRISLPSFSIVPVAIEGLVSALGIALAEELFFRGWLDEELERDYSLATATAINAILFAIAHFLKPFPEILRTWPQFPGLILLGWVLILLKRNFQGRLWAAIGFHAGLVWGYYILQVGQLASAVEGVSPWLVGVDGNAIASVPGWIILLGIGIGMSNAKVLQRF